MFNKNHLDYVSSHINQTSLVEDLLANGALDYNDLQNPEEKDIFQWLIFPTFFGNDYEKLLSVGIPVLESDYHTWVGITSFGSPYRSYVYPELINALFNFDISAEDISKVCRE